ncbi:AsmA family protein [Arvimicrobium flavum]|uniref:AsmA family protein n=1 Tax=Arvimicrobium flavum TaxID=3393320 RepID=UPI00237A38C4|nr:AsmA family protein [Mesorhizobium shangrilense]
MLGRLFVLIGGLLVLALTAALVGPYFIDWTNYRADFEREASAILGRKVTVRGEATARLLPFPSVTFSDVTVGGNADTPAMTVETFSMDAELAPFMRGEFLIFDMRLVRPKATVTVAADGTIDWAVRPSAPFGARDISLEKLTITDGEVVVRHTAGGREHVLSEINLDGSARSLVGPWHIEGMLRADGRQAALSVSTGAVDDAGGMRLRIRTNPAIYPVIVEADGTARMDKGIPTYAGAFRVVAKEDVKDELRGSEGTPRAAAKGDRAPAPPANRLGGAFSVTHERLSIDEFRFETGPVNDPYVAEGKASVDLGAEPRFSITADGAQVRLDEEGGSGGAGQSVEARLAGLQSLLSGLPMPAIPGSVQVNLPAIVAGDTMIRDVRLSAEPKAGNWDIESLAATLPGRTTVEARGTLATVGEIGFKGNLLLAIAQPSGFMAWLSKDVDEAIRRLPAAGFSSSVDLTATQQSFRDLELQLGAAKFRGEVDSRRPADARPSIKVHLDGGALDFDGLSAFASLFVSEKGTNRFSDTDLDIAVRAGPVTAAGMTAGTLDTALRLRDGTIEVDKLAIGDLAGATIGATASVKNFPVKPTGELDATLVAVDLQPLLDVLAAQYPGQPWLTALRERGASHAGLYADSEISLVAEASVDEGDETIYSLDAKGVSGGTDFTGNYRGAIAKPEARISLAFNGKNADATALMSLLGVETLPLGLTGPGSVELSAEGALRDGLATKLRFTGDHAAAGFEGSVGAAEDGPSAKGSITLEATDIEPWMMTAGLALPGMGTGTAVALKAEADYGNGLLVLSGLDGTVAEGAVAGDVNLEVKDGLPHLSGQLAMDELDVYPIAKAILGEATLEGADADWATTPFQPKSLAPLAADVDLTAGSFSVGPIATVSNASLSLRLSQEGLRISDLTGKLADGELSGLLELKNNDGSGLVSTQLKLENADISQLLRSSAIDGRGDISAALSGSGKSIEGIVAALSGSGTSSLHDVVLRGINPDAFPALIAEADRIGRDIDGPKTAAFAPALVGGGSYAAGNVDLAFSVAGGVLRAPPITLDNPHAKISVEVRGDANDRTVAADGAITYAPGEEALVGSEPTVRFALSGTPGAANLTFDTDPLAQFLTQRALEIEQARVEAMQADLLEKQRLRREARYYAALQKERDRLAEEQRRAEEDARRKADDAAQIKAEEEARIKAEEEARRQAEEQARLDAEAEAKRAAEQARREADEEAARAATQGEFPPPPTEQAAPVPSDRDSSDAFEEPTRKRRNPFSLKEILESLGN